MTASTPKPKPAACGTRDCPNKPRPDGLCRTCRRKLNRARVGAVRIPPKGRTG